MEHYSLRLERNYRDDDWLTRDEVVKVVEQNSGRPILPRSVNKYGERAGWHPDRGNPRVLLYKYSEVKDAVMRAGTGRKLHDNPSPTAVRQRAFKGRRKAEQLVQMHESLGVHEIKKELGE